MNLPEALRRERPLVGGVCLRLSREFGVEVTVVRVLFAISVLGAGIGFFLYLLLYLVRPAGQDGAAPDRLREAVAAWREALGAGLLVAGAVVGFGGGWAAAPAGAGVAGIVLLWRGGVARGPRAVLGGIVLGAGAVSFFSALRAVGSLPELVGVAVVVVVLSGLVFGPWWLRFSRALAAERTARIRAQEREEMAAHLHDSVLQTLALIQRRAEEPREVAALARRQERDLRAWLGGRSLGAEPETLAAALQAAASEVEELHGVDVEVVCVGERALDEAGRAVVAAAREALLNAARFAGVQRVDVYAEADADRLEVFVRDRGRGFDRAAVPADRRGLSESIEGRMRRHGGEGQVRSAPGDGTEVRLTMAGRGS